MSEKEKVCIVTGVGPDKGTGAEIAKLFGKKKYKVAMIARNKKNLNDLEKKYKNIFSYPCDVGDLEKFKKTIKKIKTYFHFLNFLLYFSLLKLLKYT